MIAFWLKAKKSKTLIATAVLLAVIALADWSKTPSLGILYILPMVLGALVLNSTETFALALFCAFIRSRFDYLSTTRPEIILEFVFATSSYAASGLLVSALVRNRRMVADHLNRFRQEQGLRREAEEQLRVLVASSPAAILTLNASGVIVAANRAADSLFAVPEGKSALGHDIADYLPVLSDALRLAGSSEPFRTAAQCQGYRDNGEIFLAHTWFSSYAAPQGPRLAAIVVDASEEMRDREEQSLSQLQKSNRITAAAVSHELRNMCGAISLLCSHLLERPEFASDEDFQGLVNMASGLKKITTLNLDLRATDTDTEVPLRTVLDNLRIVIESEWRGIDGSVHWHLPDDLPTVVADPHGLLQAFLNLAHNSQRAVMNASRRELHISVDRKDNRAAIRFADTGTGIANPQSLFQPFQQGADGSGLGLYVSRAVVRSYGGELRSEPQTSGACFVIELQAF